MRARWHGVRLLVVAQVGAQRFRLLRTATSLIMIALLLAIAAAIAATI